MTKFPKFNDVASITSLEDIEKKIFLLQTCLFGLKMGLSTSIDGEADILVDNAGNSQKKPHQIIFLKRRLAHLKLQKSILIKQKS